MAQARAQSKKSVPAKKKVGGKASAKLHAVKRPAAAKQPEPAAVAPFRRVGVLGAGVMGSGIAAHLANAGLSVLLLDVVPNALTEDEKKAGLTLSDKAVRNRLAATAIQLCLKAKPAPFFSKKEAELVEVGNLEDDLPKLADCDWVIEVVKEDIQVKQALFAKVEQHAKKAVVSSNTSGLSIKGMLEGRGEDFRRRFLVTHFFNPVRYMRLLEIIPGEQTDPGIVSYLNTFCTDTLGKGVVFGKDTPNFVANRIGVYAMMAVLNAMISEGYTIEEIDEIFGVAMGRPKSAVFRTADMVGVDTFVHVANNCFQSLPDDEEREIFKIPDYLQRMVEKKLLGDKTKGGFYKKVPGGLLTLDPKTGEYRPKEKASFDSTTNAKDVEDVGERVKALVAAEDRGGKLAWKLLAKTLIYSARRIGEIADDVVNVDRAMRWGFNWSQGPFETWDAIGVKASVARMEKEGLKVPDSVKKMLKSGRAGFYEEKNGVSTAWNLAKGKAEPIEKDARALGIPSLKKNHRVIQENGSTTLFDIGDGAVLLEFHTKMNALDTDSIAGLVGAVEEVEKNHEALVIGNTAENFSAGANLFMILMEAQNQNWDGLNKVVKDFQDMGMRLKYARKPVVAAPFGLTLGGGAEVTMSCAAAVAHSELYMGLVEVGVGLIPGGGGNKEVLQRAMRGAPTDATADITPFMKKAFMAVATAQVATSAAEAQELGLIDRRDPVVLNRDHHIHYAKQYALGLARAGYRSPRPERIRVAGEPGFATLKIALRSMREAHQISEHDELIGLKLAKVFTGGSVPYGAYVTEQQLLDIEREQFLALCGEEKSQARMQHMLINNAPLRN